MDLILSILIVNEFKFLIGEFVFVIWIMSEFKWGIWVEIVGACSLYCVRSVSAVIERKIVFFFVIFGLVSKIKLLMLKLFGIVFVLLSCI